MVRTSDATGLTPARHEESPLRGLGVDSRSRMDAHSNGWIERAPRPWQGWQKTPQALCYQWETARNREWHPDCLTQGSDARYSSRLEVTRQTDDQLRKEVPHGSCAKCKAIDLLFESSCVGRDNVDTQCASRAH